MIPMDRQVLLTGRCERRGHLVFEVVREGDFLYVEAPMYALGRERSTWTPMRREIARGHITRMGCSCGRSELLDDEQMMSDIRRGVTRWVIAGTNISHRRSGMDEPNRSKGIGR